MERNLLMAALLALASTASLSSQLRNQVQWSLRLDPSTAPPGSQVLGRLKAKIEPGWHMYSLTTPKGPIRTSIKVETNRAVEAFKVYQPQAKRAFDKNFNSDTETFEGEPVFLIELALKKDAPSGPVPIQVAARYQVCNDRSCIPPVTRTANASLTIDSSAVPGAASIPPGYSLFDPSAPQPPAAPAKASASSEGFGLFLLGAVALGVAAIFTPCVFPMIPITMSFFLNRQAATRRDSVIQALLFCLGIIVLFSLLGLVTTAILGPFGVVQLGSNPWVNAFIAALFIVFGFSLLGAFEITIPSAVLTRVDRASQRGGVAGTLLMGLTFSLSSFACVGPFVGTLLAASVQSAGIRPLLGMVGFATGLALPFFLLALFPAYLKRMPKSGGWLARVKMVMGFIVLAASLKYLSSIDSVMQWGLITRERFLAAWIVLFALAGLYLLGFLRLEGINKDEPMGLGRLLTAAAFLIFSLSLVPGMFGGRLGELDAYVPPATSQGNGPTEGSLVWAKNQYRESLDKARQEGKRVFVSFTGYACTNCHWMKANMFTRPEIAAAMKDFVLVELYTDGTDAASEQNQKLEESKFGTVAIPYYAILDPDEQVIATFPSLTRDPQEFLGFLKRGAKG